MAKIALGLAHAQSSTSGTSSMSASLESSSSVVGGGGSTLAAAKRGRLLIRQQRIKKESDSSSSGQQYGSDLDTPDGTTMYSAQNLLAVPQHHRFERQISEPIIPTSSAVSSPEVRSGGPTRPSHHLAVPSQQPYLVKQHSHPLLPSQTSNHSHQQAFQAISSYSLQRQLSHPTATVATVQSSTPLTLVTSSGGATHYLAPNSPMNIESDEDGSSAVATATAGTTTSATTTIPQIHLHTDRTMSPTVVLVPDIESLHQQQHHLAANTSTTTTGGSAASAAPLSDLTTPSSIRVKGEELSRSASSPLMTSRSTEIPGLDSQRSSHCPVVRDGPALGCNFCWNTIDAHGRILRRKTKYHCPECQTNLCIVPCFQEYHERQSAENPAPTGNDSTSGGGGGTGTSSGSSKSGLRNYPKSGSM